MTTRSDILFQIGYGIRLEKMQAMFLARTDRFVNFSQIVLGAAVVTAIHPAATGVAVAALAAFSFIYQPGSKATEAKAQKLRYEKLQTAAAAGLPDSELEQRFAEIQETDSQVIGSLMNPAHLGEEIRLGCEPSVQLTRLESIAAFIAGDLPRA